MCSEVQKIWPVGGRSIRSEHFQVGREASSQVQGRSNLPRAGFREALQSWARKLLESSLLELLADNQHCQHSVSSNRQRVNSQFDLCLLSRTYPSSFRSTSLDDHG
jgi:hypothetical protein